MAIPGFQDIMLPMLQFMENGKVYHIRDVIEVLADEFFRLTEIEKSELLDSGRQIKFDNRVHWARSYLVKADLIESKGRGLIQITQLGIKVLNSRPAKINIRYLQQFGEFKDKNLSNEVIDDILPEEIQTPEEQVDAIYRTLRKRLADDLLDRVLTLPPAFFERLVVDLLLAMGYGSSLDSGERIGQSGDGGVDGVIREDKLGLDTIYIQAKRYARENGVGRPAIQGFVGSLMGVGATKGVFITTSYFSEQAIQYAKNVPNLKVILIDGQQLATLMIEHNVGVSVQKTYEIKQIDENYFLDA